MKSFEESLNRAAMEDGLLNTIRSVIKPPEEAVFYVTGSYVLEAASGLEPGGIMLVCKNDAAGVAKLLGEELSVKPIGVNWHNGVFHLYPGGALPRGVTVMSMDGNRIEDHLVDSGFTVLSMAVDLGAGPPFKLIDPLNGCGDIESGKLKVSRKEAVAGNPDRCLTALDLFGRFKLEPDSGLVSELREASSGLKTIPAGRVWRRMLRSFEGERLSSKAEFMRDTGIIDAVLPELAAVYDVPQNYYHHLGVWDHTLETLDNLEKITGDLSSVFPANGALINAHLSRKLEGEFSRRSYLFLMGLLHDIGKAGTMKVVQSGRIRFKGHQIEGAKLTSDIASRFGVGNRAGQYMFHFSKNHMKLGFLAKEKETAAGRLSTVRELGDLAVDLSVHSLADRLSARGEAVTEEAVSGFTRMTRRVVADYFWLKKRSPLIDGNDVKVHGGLVEGPQIGELLMKVALCRLEGIIENRQQALEYIAPDFKGKMKC